VGHDPGLGHGLDEDHPGSHRPPGKMPPVEIFIPPEAIGADDSLGVHFPDLVEEAKGGLLGNGLENHFPQAPVSLHKDLRLHAEPIR